MTRSIPVQVDPKLWQTLLLAFDRSLPKSLTAAERKAVLGSGYGLAHAVTQSTGAAIDSALATSQPRIVYRVALPRSER